MSKAKRERLTSTKCTEVLGSFGDNVSTKSHFDATGSRAADGDIEEADGVGPFLSIVLCVKERGEDEIVWNKIEVRLGKI